MSERNCRALLEARWAKGLPVGVGLDPRQEKIPQHLRNAHARDQALYHFLCAIVDATHDHICAFKPNIAFFEALGDAGIVVLRSTITHIRMVAPEVAVILDGKRGYIGDTNAAYAQAAFDYFNADGVTVNPYLGFEALGPFMEENRRDRGIFVLCRTSNKGAGEFQDLIVQNDEYPEWGGRGEPLFKIVARHIATQWNKHGNCGLVVGATAPEELRSVRGIADNLPILIPGIGAQGGDLEATVKAGRDSRGRGMIINLSRSVLQASSGTDFAAAGRAEVGRVTAESQKYARVA